MTVSPLKAPVESRSVFLLMHEIYDEGVAGTPHELAEEILNRLKPDEYADVLAQILPNYCARHLSKKSGKGGGNGIKKKGTAWGGWKQMPLWSGLEDGNWVKWPEFTLEMALANAGHAEKREKSAARTKAWHLSIAQALTQHKAAKVGKLPAHVREQLQNEYLGLNTED